MSRVAEMSVFLSDLFIFRIRQYQVRKMKYSGHFAKRSVYRNLGYGFTQHLMKETSSEHRNHINQRNDDG